MQAVTPTAALHDTAGAFVDNLDLAVDDHVIHILGEHGVSLQQLVHRMHAFRLEGIVGIKLILAALLLFRGSLPFLDGSHLVAQTRHQEEVLVTHRVGQHFVALVGQFHGTLLLVDDKIQFVGYDALLDVLVLEGGPDDLALGILENLLDARLAEILDQGLVLGQAFVGTQEEDLTLVLDFARGDEFLGLVQGLVDKILLGVVEALHVRLVLDESLVARPFHRTGNDERGTGIIDKHGVHLIHNGKMVLALDKVLRIDGHVVAQVVKAEFVVGTEGDVGLVCLAARIGAGLVLVDAIDAQPVEHIKRAHPLRVSFGQVVVDGDHMDALACQGIEEHRKRSHEGFAFTGGHLGDLALMEHRTADQLHIVVHHIPGDHIAAGHPAVAPDGIVAVHVDEIVAGAQVTVEIGGLHADPLVFLETARRRFDDGEGFRKHFVENLFYLFVNGLDQFVQFRSQFLLAGDLHLGVGQLFTDLRHLLLFRRRIGAYFVAQCGALGTQAVVAQLVNTVIGRKDELQGRRELFQVTVGLGAEQFFQKVCHISLHKYYNFFWYFSISSVAAENDSRSPRSTASSYSGISRSMRSSS